MSVFKCQNAEIEEGQEMLKRFLYGNPFYLNHLLLLILIRNKASKTLIILFENKFEENCFHMDHASEKDVKYLIEEAKKELGI